MLTLSKTLHVLAVGLWFGANVFFTFVVGLTLFGHLEAVAGRPAGSRPLWFPVPAEYERPRPSERFPEPLRKDQGTRAAGEAISPMFDQFFALQGACAALALATALTWWGRPGAAHRPRAVVLALALTTVAVGWWLERRVSELRDLRNAAAEVVLKADEPISEAVGAADAARAEFGRWHTYSLLLNFVTLGLVTAAMALSAALPQADPPRVEVTWKED